MTYGFDEAEGLVDPTSPETSAKKKVIVEFSSPNLAAEFDGNHLRSTILGNHVAKLYAAMGWAVTKVNYLGDWGKQIGLLAAGWSRFGSEETFAKEPLRHLVDVYSQIEKQFKPELEASKKAKAEERDTAEIEAQGLFAERDAFFKRLEEQEPEAIALWKRFQAATIENLRKTYAKLGIVFDAYDGESAVSAESIAEVEAVLKEKGVYEESDGAWIIEYKRYGTAVVRGRTGSTTYLLRDVGAVLDREKALGGFDKMIYVVSQAQDLHFHQVFQTLELMGRTDLVGKVQHVGFGKLNGLSAELNSPQLLNEIVEQSAKVVRDGFEAAVTEELFLENTDAVAETVGWTALVAQDMASRRTNACSIDRTRIASMEGDTGFSLQNSYARLISELAKMHEKGTDVPPTPPGDFSVLQAEHYTDLLRVVAQYPDVTAAAYRSLEPSLVLAWLYRVSEPLWICLDEDFGEGEEGADGEEGNAGESSKAGESVIDVERARVALYEVVAKVFENGMLLLGVRPATKTEEGEKASLAELTESLNLVST
jgi:arginyl-tRNA synthetase